MIHLNDLAHPYDTNIKGESKNISFKIENQT